MSAQAVPTLIVGNHLSQAGDSPKVCEELAARLRSLAWPIWTTSSQRNRAARLADMVASAAVHRKQYQVAQVDVYSGPSFVWAEAVGWTLRRLGKPFVLTLHGGELPRFAERYPDRVRRLLESAAAVTAPSDFLQERFRTVRPDLRLIPNAVDLPRYPFRPRQQPRLRLVWMRAFHEVYAPTLAVETLAELRRDSRDAELDMFGPDRGDGSFARARSHCRELDVEPYVRVGTGIDKGEVPRRLAAADIFLNTSRADNAPVSLIEAAACGLPIVTTDVGGISRLFTHEQDALLVPEASPVALADAVRRLRDEPGLAARLSSNARIRALAFGWDGVLADWGRLLNEAAQGGHG